MQYSHTFMNVKYSQHEMRKSLPSCSFSRSAFLPHSAQWKHCGFRTIGTSVFVLKLVLLTAIACFHLALIGNMDVSWCALIGTTIRKLLMGSLGTRLTISMSWYDSERWVCPTSKLHQLRGVQLPLVKGWGYITVSEIVSNKLWLWSDLEECHWWLSHVIWWFL